MQSYAHLYLALRSNRTPSGNKDYYFIDHLQYSTIEKEMKAALITITVIEIRGAIWGILA